MKKKSVPPINEWSATKYGVALYVNPNLFPKFPDGVSLDVEDDEQGNFVGIGIFDGNACYYWSDWELAKQLTIPKFVAHNGRSDLSKLKKWGFKVDESWLLWDTQLYQHIIDSSRKGFGLKHLVKDLLGIEYPSYEDLTGTKTSKSHITLDKLPLDLVSEYNAMDCYATYKLWEHQSKQLRYATGEAAPETHYFEKLAKPLAFVWQRMEERGIRVDLPYLEDLKAKLEEQRAPIESEIKNELGDINLNSPKQLLGALHAKGIFPQKQGKPSTDKRALEYCKRFPVVNNLLRFSEVETLLTSFVYPYLERKQAVVHPFFNQTGTRTGRPSCSNPNLLQIPKRTVNGKLVRRMFIAREGHLLGDCDFGQIEPRLLAHLSKDPTLCQMFNDGVDFHSFTAQRLFRSDAPEHRNRAKILNLSVGYRATFKSVSQQLKCGERAAQDEIDRWWAMFPGLYDWEQKLIFESKKTGYFTTLLGRRIKVEGLEHGNKWRREAAERQLINNIAQGSAAEVMQLAMLDVDKAGIDILVQVYDELLFESPEESISGDMELVIEKMCNAVKLDVPLTVDGNIGQNWSDCK